MLQHTTRRPRGRSRDVGLQQRHRDAFQNGVSGNTVQTISGHDEQESSPRIQRRVSVRILRLLQ